MRRRFSILILLLFTLMGGLVIGFRVKYRPVVQKLALAGVSSAASDMINDAIAEQIDNQTIQYDRMIYFEKDLNGRITALKTNMSEINRLKSSILNLLNDRILAMNSDELGIPVGSLLLPELLPGKGPAIPVQILSVRNSEADFESDFSEAGINQTLHRLVMAVSMDVSVLVMGQSASVTVCSRVVVAETVIVGEVPTTYLQSGGKYGSERQN